MKLSPIEESLLKTISEFQIVDAHEHLPPEKIRLKQNVDVFTLFSQYTRVDLWAAGMPKEYWDKIHDPNIPIEKRWEMFSPHLKNIKYGSYARPAFIAAQEFYGHEDINESNYRSLSEQISAGNTPGIYRRILRDKCKIRVALTQADRTDYDLDLLVPLMPLNTYAAIRSRKDIEEHATNLGEKVKTIDDYIDLIRTGLERWKSEGVVGIKALSCPYSEPKKGNAAALFDRLINNEKMELPGIVTPHNFGKDFTIYNDQLYSYIMEEMLKMAAEMDLVVAVHTGMWGDFRYLDPQHMIPILIRHPETRFDIYHMGIPFVRETAIIGKNFPNVWLNLCWCAVISPKITRQALDELIDLVPINKIIAFGGDYGLSVEKVYGHLIMAREIVAKVLGHRVEEKSMTEDEAIEIARKWFFYNPKNLYQL